MAEFIAVLTLLSCNGKKHLKNYEILKSLSLQNNNSFELLYEYDIQHPDFFEVKIDLASIYIIQRNYLKAEEYLKRAEHVLKNAISKEYLCNYYGLNASLCLMKKEYDKSLEWCKKSIAIKGYGAKYQFLEGQIDYVMGKKEEAFLSLKRGFSECGVEASIEDKKLYAILLSEYDEFDDCIKLINEILIKGAYYYGLGQFASTIYEKKGLIFESILYAYLDYEYASCFLKTDDEQFLKNLHSLEMKYSDEKLKKDIRNAIDCITSVIKKDEYFPDIINEKNPVYEYIKCKHDILKLNFDAGIIDKILSLKNIFDEFPIYHYLVSETFINGKFDVFPTESLERILDISTHSNFSDYAREKLGESLGLTDKESKKLMTFDDIYRSCHLIINQKDAKEVERICQLISLPDNKYVYFAMNILSEVQEKDFIKKIFEEKIKKADGRLKERLIHILNQWSNT